MTGRLGAFLGLMEFAQEIATDPNESCAIWRRVWGGESFLVRLVKIDSRGTELYRMEAEHITPGKLPEDVFIAPVDYKMITLPSRP
jgi:hypothetical protein